MTPALTAPLRFRPGARIIGRTGVVQALTIRLVLLSAKVPFPLRTVVGETTGREASPERNVDTTSPPDRERSEGLAR